MYLNLFSDKIRVIEKEEITHYMIGWLNWSTLIRVVAGVFEPKSSGCRRLLTPFRRWNQLELFQLMISALYKTINMKSKTWIRIEYWYINRALIWRWHHSTRFTLKKILRLAVYKALDIETKIYFFIIKIIIFQLRKINT